MSTDIPSDPALPGLPVLLDDDRLAAWLGSADGQPVRVARQYLRYKPGTSCVLGALVDRGQGPEAVLVAAHSAAGGVKVHKAQHKAPPDTVLAIDRHRRLLAVHAVADRDLPGLRALATPLGRSGMFRHLGIEGPGVDPGDLPLTTLSYKPQRRWVGRLGEGASSVLIRSYRPDDLATTLAGYPDASEGAWDGVLTQRIGQHGRSGLAALSYLPGDTVLSSGTVLPGEAVQPDPAADILVATGTMLARHHSRSAPVARYDVGAESAAVRATVRQVVRLLPHLGPTLDSLESDVLNCLATDGASGPSGTLHGDFSLDQVVVSPTGNVGLIDLDRARIGPVALDLGSLAATAHLNGVADVGSLVGSVADGLPAAPSPAAVHAHTGAQLLRRLAEPFRRCHPDWPTETARLVAVTSAVVGRHIREPA